MSATAARLGRRDEAPSGRAISEPAWSWPIDLTRFDQTPTLSPPEADALTALGQSVRGWCQPGQQQRSIWRALNRLVSPLAAVRATWSPQSSHQRYHADIAVAALLRGCAVEQAPYWAWADSTWVRLLGATRAAFQVVQPPWVDRNARHYVIALAYLLDCFTDLGQLGHYNRLALAEKIFGPARIGAAVDRLISVLHGWGYQDARKGKGFPRVLCEVLLVNRSPRLGDLAPAVLGALRRTATVDNRAHLFQLQRALGALGLMDGPEAPVGRRPVIEGVAATWIAWAHRWEATSTLTPSTRRGVRLSVLKAGRWLRVEHPTIAEPAAWTRELCAAYVAAVDRMRIGDFAQRRDPLGGRRGQPLSPRAKNGFLGAVRQLFRDCQEWGWIPRRFDPSRALATPRAVMALIGPRPRVIADDLWAKLLWAGLNLADTDLTTSRRYCYPVTLVRALAVTWLFAGLRSDEIVRLRVGCIRWQAQAEGARHRVCLLDVPAHKTGAPFTKPVDALVGQAIEAWEAVRPAQPALLDPRTGEVVPILFCLRATPVARDYLNRALIPVLCRKAGVPRADARGGITSHRARATIASQLYNAKEPMTLFELQGWLGHRSPLSTQHYTQITPTRLAQAYADAGYFARNLRTIEVLVDREAVQSGAAASGTAWQYFDLGHGYCTYNFFEQCPHRMACARCDFYLPKASTQAQLLEAKGHLQRMLTTIPLTEPERAAVEDGAAAVEQLLDRLADTPTPAGPTPREFGGIQTPLLTINPLPPLQGA